MNILFLTMTLALIFLAYITGCSGLECHVCSSADHTACEDPFDPARAEAAGFLTRCKEPRRKDQKVLCRKTHQTVLGKTRVIRACGYANHTEECVGSRNAEVVVRSCICYKKGCNGAGAVALAAPALLLAAALRFVH